MASQLCIVLAVLSCCPALSNAPSPLHLLSPQVHNEEEIRRILPLAQKHQVPVTFRAAGTSLSAQVCDACLGRADGFWVVVRAVEVPPLRHLAATRLASGSCTAAAACARLQAVNHPTVPAPASDQALTDSVLLKISHTGRNFRNYTVHGDGSSITVEPGLIGGEVRAGLLALCAALGSQAELAEQGAELCSWTGCEVRSRHSRTLPAVPTGPLPTLPCPPSLLARSTASWRPTRPRTSCRCSTRSGPTRPPSTRAW